MGSFRLVVGSCYVIVTRLPTSDNREGLHAASAEGSLCLAFSSIGNEHGSEIDGSMYGGMDSDMDNGLRSGKF